MKTAFDECVEAYDAFRPGYPAALIDHLAARFSLQPGCVVVDVGAGTGRATALMAERGYNVIAVEPSDGMRARGAALEARYSGRVRFVNGLAEATGLADSAADLIVSAQAFHWFDPSRALPEFARVLKPGAGLALFWNDRDLERTAIASDLEALIARLNPAYSSGYRRHPWAEIIRDCGLFRAIEQKHFSHSVEMTADALFGLTRSYSYVGNVLDEAGLKLFEQELRQLVHRHYGDRPFEYAYRVDLYTAERA